MDAVTAADVLRLLAIALFSGVAGQAAVVNYHVWRSRQRGPIRVPHLLAWHVHAVTIYALGVHACLLGLTVERLGEPDIRFPYALAGLLLFGVVGNLCMGIIGQVTAARRRLQDAAL